MAIPADLWKVESSIHTAVADIELRHYAFPSPSEVLEEQDRPILTMTLPGPHSSDGKARFTETSASYQEMRPLVFRPPDRPLHAFGRGGPTRILVCAFERPEFEALTGLSNWSDGHLRRCLDLRAPSIANAMRALLAELRHPGFGGQVMIESIASQIAVFLGRTFQACEIPLPATNRLSDWQLRRIREILIEVEQGWPTVADLAKACGISRCHLSRSFAQTTGISISSYSTAIRIGRAKEMLRHGKLPVGQVAFKLGFASAASFSTAFRREVCMAPRAYARKVLYELTR